jgi:hypothetical protein
MPHELRKNSAARDVVLYYSHVDSPSVRREVAALRTQLGARYDIIVVGYCRSPDALRGIDAVPTRAYSASDLCMLPYPGKIGRFKPEDEYIGNCDLVPMRFFQDRPDYDHYWIIENDVRFGGDWSSLFEELASSDADLLCTTVQTYADNPDWVLWPTLMTGGEEIPLDRRVKGYIPFGRVSRRLLEACDARCREGWSGHPEVLWPTIAIEAGLRVEDIGGDGPFTPASRCGRYYYNTPNHWSLFPGTFVYRPCFADRDLSGAECQFPGWLWHPVKACD